MFERHKNIAWEEKQVNRMKSTAFCINCDCWRKYKKEREEVTVTVRGLCFSYAETKAVCENCNEELYVPEINDINVQARENALFSENILFCQLPMTEVTGLQKSVMISE